VTHDQTEAMTLGDRVAVLRKGELQQVASPRGLYEQPVNLFVAGFIGSPPMNFLPGRVDGDTLHLPLAEVPLDERLRAAVGDRSLVIVGIRPEHVSDADLLEEGRARMGVRFETDVDVTEWLGAELYAYIPFATEPAVAAKLEDLDRELDGEGMRSQVIVAPDADSRVREGGRAELWFDPARLLVFDPETGANLTRDEDTAREIDERKQKVRRASPERAQRRERGDGSPGGAAGAGTGGSAGTSRAPERAAS